MVNVPRSPLRVAEKLMVFPLILPFTSAAPRSPPIVPVNVLPSCVSVRVWVIVPFRVSKETNHVPATFDGFVSAVESCALAALAQARRTTAINAENTDECRFIGKSPLPDSTQGAAQRLQPRNPRYSRTPTAEFVASCQYPGIVARRTCPQLRKPTSHNRASSSRNARENKP